jgi:hypothetical protein
VSQEKAAGLIGVGLKLGTIYEPPFNVNSIAAVKIRIRQAFDSYLASSGIPVIGISRKGKKGQATAFAAVMRRTSRTPKRTGNGSHPISKERR